MVKFYVYIQWPCRKRGGEYKGMSTEIAIVVESADNQSYNLKFVVGLWVNLLH